MPPTNNHGFTPPGAVVIRRIGLGELTFDVEIEYATPDPESNGFNTVTEINITELAVGPGGALLLVPNGGGPAHVISPSGYVRATVVRR